LLKLKLISKQVIKQGNSWLHVKEREKCYWFFCFMTSQREQPCLFFFISHWFGFWLGCSTYDCVPTPFNY